MSSTINASEYVLLDNAQNPTLTPLQRTPSMTPSDCSEASEAQATSARFFEPFSQDLELHRLNHYFESILLARNAEDQKTENTSVSKAEALLNQLYPQDNLPLIFAVRFSSFLRKHGKTEWAKITLDAVSTRTIEDDPNTLNLVDRINYWYLRSLCALESGLHDYSVESMINRGIAEAAKFADEEEKKKHVNTGYFINSVYYKLKDDEVDARFWKGMLPNGFKLPQNLYSKHESLFKEIPQGPYPHPTATSTTTSTSSSTLSKEKGTVTDLSGMTTQDILMRDVVRLQREMSEVFDVVYVKGQIKRDVY